LHGGLHVPPWRMFRRVPTWLQQRRVVVAHVEPPCLPILIGVYQLVGQVLPDGIFTHLHPGSSNYSGAICSWLGLHPEEFGDQDPVGLDPMNASQKWTKMEVWKILLGLRLRY
jgi:hypothetical protein